MPRKLEDIFTPPPNTVPVHLTPEMAAWLDGPPVAPNDRPASREHRILDLIRRAMIDDPIRYNRLARLAQAVEGNPYRRK
jgi:hypothetical protein